MPTTDLLVSFLLATAVFAYIPGPAMLYASTQTIVRGRRAGWMAVFGLHMGGYIHVVAAAFGLAILFTTVPLLFSVMKFIGAAYLCWLGLKLIFSKDTIARDDIEVSSKSPRRAFWDSVTIEILNPKTAIFYLAFLPQFTDPAAALPIWGQLLILGTAVNIMFSSADVGCVVLADRVTTWLKSSASANQALQRIGGGLLIALGVNLALQKQ